MGANFSKQQPQKLENASAGDVAIFLTDFADGRFSCYANLFRDNLVSGKVIARSMRVGVTYGLEELLTDVGISTALHQNILIAELETMVQTWEKQKQDQELKVEQEVAAGEEVTSVFTDLAGLKIGGDGEGAAEAVVTAPPLSRAFSLGTTQYMECCMCMESMNEPVTLPCGHNGCKSCLGQWFKSSDTCPECRLQIPSDMRKNLHTNIALKAIINKAFPELAEKQRKEKEEEMEKEKEAKLLSTAACSVLLARAPIGAALVIADAGYSDINGYWGVDPLLPSRNGRPLYKKLLPDGVSFAKPGETGAGTYCLGWTETGRGWMFFNCGADRNDWPYNAQGIDSAEPPVTGWVRKESCGVSPMPTLAWTRTSSTGGAATGEGSTPNEVQEVTGITIRGNPYKWVGQVLNGLPHGNGTMTITSGPFEGDVYVGACVASRRTGQGHYVWNNGTHSGGVYDGSWLDDAKSGYGVYTWPDGKVYSGEWVNDKQNGTGCLLSQEGTVLFVGQWMNGREQRE